MKSPGVCAVIPAGAPYGVKRGDLAFAIILAGIPRLQRYAPAFRMTGGACAGRCGSRPKNLFRVSYSLRAAGPAAAPA